MCKMGAFYTLCCHTDEKEEKNAILCRSSSGKDIVLNERKVQWKSGSGRGQKSKAWSNCHTLFSEEESDKELQAFIMMRNQVDKDTVEWEKLNYDIHSLRCARREVCVRWRKILLMLGYQMEVDSLLAVNKQCVLSDGEHLERARELLHGVCEESSLFPHGAEPNDRYLFIMDRLVSLDSAEDFVKLAKEKYPRTASYKRDNEINWSIWIAETGH